MNIYFCSVWRIGWVVLLSYRPTSVDTVWAHPCIYSLLGGQVGIGWLKMSSAKMMGLCSMWSSRPGFVLMAKTEF